MQQQKEYNELKYGKVKEPLILLAIAISNSASCLCASGFGFGAAGNVTRTILILSLLPCNQISDLPEYILIDKYKNHRICYKKYRNAIFIFCILIFINCKRKYGVAYSAYMIKKNESALSDNSKALAFDITLNLQKS